MISSIVARVLFYPSLAFNILMEKISKRDWYNRIDEHVILGALPLRSMSDTLVKEEGVTAVVSINEDYELRFLAYQPDEWKRIGVNNIRFQVVDMFGAPSQEVLIEGVDFIKKNIVNEGVVYVHCKAGRSRSATLVGCYLMEKNNWTPDEAVSFIKTKRPHILIHPMKMQALKDFYKNHVIPTSIN
uniref:Phosphatidylglycerophosphatase and protein-tyrosine phosphatase 1 n=1 Tax=Evadne anonyx TaxID=141404 RepID=A0A9N6WYB6_9CRUS|nr:EOG090X0GSS [Evadne anonyx]